MGIDDSGMSVAIRGERGRYNAMGVIAECVAECSYPGVRGSYNWGHQGQFPSMECSYPG